jgi:capsid protein
MMSATWFDHAIATVAPRMAARRVMARQAFETLTRGYDGAARGRRTEGWRAPGSSADTEIGVAGALLRDRMRDLVRNNPHAAKAVAVLVNNIIGAGIMPRAASGDDKLDRKVDALFERWTAECDADGQLDFYGLQTLICREMVEAGEVLVRRRLRRATVCQCRSNCRCWRPTSSTPRNPASLARGGWCRGSSSTRSPFVRGVAAGFQKLMMA